MRLYYLCGCIGVYPRHGYSLSVETMYSLHTHNVQCTAYTPYINLRHSAVKRGNIGNSFLLLDSFFFFFLFTTSLRLKIYVCIEYIYGYTTVCMKWQNEKKTTTVTAYKTADR